MIAARGISFVREGQTILENITLVVRPGQRIGIVGPNGSGKSTLIRLLAGELVPSVGDVFLGDRRVHVLDFTSRARQVAVLAQEQPLSFPFTVREVIDMGRLPHQGSAEGCDRSLVGRLLQLWGLQALADRTYSTLSGGERQRVHLARVLAQALPDAASGPRVLLLDEPTNHLDLRYQKVLRTVVRMLAQRNFGVVIASHDIPFVVQAVDLVVVLHQGRLLALGPPLAVFRSPLVQHVFGVDFLPVLGRSRKPDLLNEAAFVAPWFGGEAENTKEVGSDGERSGTRHGSSSL